MKPIKIAIAGHVDHGKSTLIGKILKETNQVFTDRQKKIENICATKGMKFEYAFLLDAFEEEQKQGITIDKLEIPWQYQNQKYIFIDTPGHVEFIKNMFSGSSNADIALIMIDANEGVQAQTKQHLSILNLLGLKKIIFVVNKMDKIKFDQNIFNEIKIDLLKLSEKYNFLNCPIIPVSAYDGDNLFNSSSNLSWYNGSNLIEAITSVAQIKLVSKNQTRISIQDIYKFDDKRIYAGIVLSGEINIGDKIQFSQSNTESIISTFETWGNASRKNSFTENEIISFTLKDPLFLPKGEIGFTENSAPFLNDELIASIYWFANTPPNINQKYFFKIANQKHQVKIKEINQSNTPIYQVQIQSDSKISFDNFESSEKLGRFVLLEDYNICAAGVVSHYQSKEKSLEHKDINSVIWLTGLSGAGKSTIAIELKKLLNEKNIFPVLLDGDDLREGINKDLGFDYESRVQQTIRAAHIAKILTKQKFPVIVSLISPYEEARKLARETFITNQFIEVFIDVPYEDCQKRDPKGLYKMARDGSVSLFTGRDSLYEAPKTPEIHLDNLNCSAKENAQRIYDYLFQHINIR